jgi:4-hydroxy-4-methyl-2-oxoglutarate aldolase
VVVVTGSSAADVLEAGLARVEKERETRARLEAGELGVDFYGLRRVIDELGIVYLDDEPEGGA